MTRKEAIEIPIDECIEIYFNKIKETVHSINDNPDVNNVLGTLCGAVITNDS